MTRKIKSHALPDLFRLFVCQKLLIGLIIAGSGLTLLGEVKAQNHSTSEKVQSDLIEYKSFSLNSDTTKIFDVVEQMPQFPGGEEALMKYITQNIHYPVKDFENGIQGRVICHFLVNRKGEISHVEILRSLDSSCDIESIRVIRTLPKFIPAKQNGVSVNVWYTLPVIFKLENAKKQYSTTKKDSVDFIQRVEKFKPDKYHLDQTEGYIGKDEEGIYTVVEDMPQFPGGENGLKVYFNKNIKYPETKKEIRGTVIVHFEITKTGEIGRVELIKSLDFEVTKTGGIEHVETIKSLDTAFDNEAVRVVKSMPKWTPGKYNGENVNVWYNIPIKFMLNQPEMKSTNSGETLDIYESVKQMPQFPGGEKELVSYISKNLVYPASAKHKDIQGEVYVRFVVLDTGKLNKIEVVRSLTPDCDAEAMRIVKSFPEWIPGKSEGKNINVYYTISVPFKLEK